MSAECDIAIPGGCTVYMTCAFSHAFICCTGIDIRKQLAIADGDSAKVTVSADKLCLFGVAAAAGRGTREPVE